MDKKFGRAIPQAIVVAAAIVTVFAVTVERNDIELASNDQSVPGFSGIARPHPPLDRAPGQALRIPL
jgi:hypothetical protein